MDVSVLMFVEVVVFVVVGVGVVVVVSVEHDCVRDETKAICFCFRCRSAWS